MFWTSGLFVSYDFSASWPIFRKYSCISGLEEEKEKDSSSSYR